MKFLKYYGMRTDVISCHHLTKASFTFISYVVNKLEEGGWEVWVEGKGRGDVDDVNNE